MADEFFARLAETVSTPIPVGEAPAQVKEASPHRRAWLMPAFGAGKILILGLVILSGYF